jgi:putative membrane protein
MKVEARTPIIGREKVIGVATKLALKDPEEADANALFGAVRIYDTLNSGRKGEEYEVAAVAGSEFGEVTADRKLTEELKETLATFPADSVVLVTDGFADETVIPIIQSHVSIMSVRRIVVRHSQSIEESYALLSRYARRVFEEPQYSRLALGVPGVILIVLGMLWYFDLLVYAGVAFMFIIGVLLLVKGFGLDRRLMGLSITGPAGYIRLVSSLAALAIMAVNIYQTYVFLSPHVPTDPSLVWTSLPSIIGMILVRATDLTIVAFTVFLVGSGVYNYFVRDTRMWRDVVGVVMCLSFREIAFRASDILKEPIPPQYITDPAAISLLLAVTMGIAATGIAIFLVFRMNKRYASYFRKVESGEVGQSEKG